MFSQLNVTNRKALIELHCSKADSTTLKRNVKAAGRTNNQFHFKEAGSNYPRTHLEAIKPQI